MLFKEVKPLLDKLGITSPTEYEELKWLYRHSAHAASRVQESILVECGTLNAASAITMGAAIKWAMDKDPRRVGRLITIDNYHSYYKGNRPGTLSPADVREKIELAGLSHIVTVVEADANEYLETLEPESVGLLWLDALHTYKHVKQNLEIGEPKVINGGAICGHDYCWQGEGVVRAVEEFKRNPQNNLCGFGTHWTVWWTFVNRSGG